MFCTTSTHTVVSAAAHSFHLLLCVLQCKPMSDDVCVLFVVCCVLCAVCGVWGVLCAVYCVQLCNRPDAVEGCMNSAAPDHSTHIAQHNTANCIIVLLCAVCCVQQRAVCCMMWAVFCVLYHIDTHSSFCSSTQLPPASLCASV